MDFGAIVYLGTPLVLMVLGLVVGRAREKSHLEDLDLREAVLRGMLVTDTRGYVADVDLSHAATMVTGETVIASDYLKNVLAGLRNIFGGEMQSYLTLVSRARREAILRMMEQAHRRGYDAICNVRLETADIGANTSNRKGGMPMAAVHAWGTAYRRRVPQVS
jgi:uncharacterized protein YbjQ (UPF0145 family)